METRLADSVCDIGNSGIGRSFVRPAIALLFSQAFVDDHPRDVLYLLNKGLSPLAYICRGRAGIFLGRRRIFDIQ